MIENIELTDKITGRTVPSEVIETVKIADEIVKELIGDDDRFVATWQNLTYRNETGWQVSLILSFEDDRVAKTITISELSAPHTRRKILSMIVWDYASGLSKRALAELRRLNELSLAGVGE